jgi:diadenosine tetraphosphatase ApaH/serine/threonine PP2A family protein phosphatase
MVIELGPDDTPELKTEDLFQLRPGFKYLINVGSIGQPRDGDWRACLIIYDEDLQRIEIKRLEYDLSKAQDKILKAGLPDFLAIRLQYGK